MRDGDIIKPIRTAMIDFAETYGISDRSTTYRARQETTDRLYECDIKTDDENGCHHRRSRWVRAVKHLEG
jgi:hypothetical protein